VWSNENKDDLPIYKLLENRRIEELTNIVQLPAKRRQKTAAVFFFSDPVLISANFSTPRVK
jgi:hypothetical protein